jgi:hypothetical protein
MDENGCEHSAEIKLMKLEAQKGDEMEIPCQPKGIRSNKSMAASLIS